MKKVILIAILALVSTGAWRNSYGVEGYAGESTGCDSVVTSFHDSDGDKQAYEEFWRYLSWVSGYISASNRNSVLGYKYDSYDFMMVGLADHCTDNPLDTLADAAEAIIERLIKKE